MRHTLNAGKFTLEKFSFCHCILEYSPCSVLQFVGDSVSVTSKTCYQLAESEAGEASPYHCIKNLTNFSVSVWC